MSFSVNFPLFTVVLCLVSAVLSSALKKRAARILTLCLALICSAGNGMLCVYLFRLGDSVTYLMGHYPAPWGNELILTPLEALTMTIFSLVLFLTVCGGKLQLSEKVLPEKGSFYYVMADLILSALTVLLYTNDIFTGYVFIEICTLSSCGILMIRESGKTILASVRYMIFSLIGSGLFLLGVILLYDITGHLLMPNLKEAVTTLHESGEYRLPLLTSMCLITMGLAIKSGLFPFHIWMVDTYGNSIPASSGLLSGLISKGYIFLLIKLIFRVFTPGIFYGSGIQNIIFVLGSMGVIIGSVGAIQENNILRMDAYSSAAQIGYIYMGIGLSPTLGIEAALYHIMCHALTKPPLFLASGMLSEASGGAKKFRNLKGSGHKDPAAGLCFSFEALSMIGIPLTMGFISKYLFGIAAFEVSGIKMMTTLLVLAVSTVLNTMYFARTIIRIFTRDAQEPAAPALLLNQTEPVPEHIPLGKNPEFVLASFVFVLLNLSMGIAGKPFIGLLATGLSVLK